MPPPQAIRNIACDPSVLTEIGNLIVEVDYLESTAHVSCQQGYRLEPNIPTTRCDVFNRLWNPRNYQCKYLFKFF